MKIKLNMTKDLKRILKQKAKEKELERNDYIYEIIAEFISKKEAVWGPKIETILEVSKLDEMSPEERAKTEMKKTTKKLQALILDIDEKSYYCLALVAKKSKTTKEELLINLLTNITR